MPITGLYIHIPFCISKCPYCGFFSKPAADYDTNEYVEALIKEIKQSEVNPKEIETIYIGGGTPTILEAKSLFKLLGYISKYFNDVKEFTIETNPASVKEFNFKNLSDLGVNRLSVGVQSFNEAELKFLCRRYKVRDIEDCVISAADQGFINIGIDLIFAIPASSLKSWRQSIQKALLLPIKHISAYSLSFDRGTQFTNLLEQGKLKAVDGQTDRDMYFAAIEEFSKAGFEHYEISNFAKHGYQCSHNLKYWNGEEYLGIGAAAGSFYDMTRYENISDIGAYIKSINSGIDPIFSKDVVEIEDYARQTAILMLRKTEGVDFELFYCRTKIDFLDFFAAEIEQNLNKGLLEISSKNCHLSRQALPIADSIFSDFA